MLEHHAQSQQEGAVPMTDEDVCLNGIGHRLGNQHVFEPGSKAPLSSSGQTSFAVLAEARRKVEVAEKQISRLTKEVEKLKGRQAKMEAILRTMFEMDMLKAKHAKMEGILRTMMDQLRTRHKRKKAKTNSEPSAKQGKVEVPRGVEDSSSKPKGAAMKSDRISMDDNQVDRKSMANPATPFETSHTKEDGDELVGKKVMVWCRTDQMFYEGLVDSFDFVEKKHKVYYTDGVVKMLNLREERWEFVGGESMPAGQQATKCRNPDPAPEMHKKKITKTSSEPSAKQGKIVSGCGEASFSKLKGEATKSCFKSKDDSKVEGKSKDNPVTPFDVIGALFSLKTFGTIEYGDNLVGSRVKVWWPNDEKFYEGVVDSFDPVKMKHKIMYDDGDVEVLSLRCEKWEFV